MVRHNSCTTRTGEKLSAHPAGLSGSLLPRRATALRQLLFEFASFVRDSLKCLRILTGSNPRTCGEHLMKAGVGPLATKGRPNLRSIFQLTP